MPKKNGRKYAAKRIDRDNLEKCASDPTIVPFAGSQGGKVTGDNLYDEVKNGVETWGYLQTGFHVVENCTEIRCIIMYRC